MSGQEGEGRQEFARAGCATCHGPSAKGADAPALAGLTRPYSEFVKIVREGTGEMPAHSKDDVTDEQLTVIYKWLVQLSPELGARGWGLVLPASSQSESPVPSHESPVPSNESPVPSP